MGGTIQAKGNVSLTGEFNVHKVRSVVELDLANTRDRLPFSSAPDSSSITNYPFPLARHTTGSRGRTHRPFRLPFLHHDRVGDDGGAYGRGERKGMVVNVAVCVGVSLVYFLTQPNPLHFNPGIHPPTPTYTHKHAQWLIMEEFLAKAEASCSSLGAFLRGITKPFIRDRERWTGALICDAVCMAVALDPTVVTHASTKFVDVELEGKYGRGMTVVDWEGRLSGRAPNVRIVERIDMGAFHNMLLRIVDTAKPQQQQRDG
jgi:hypothetical protein